MTAVAQHSSRLIFEMFYITDELLYYALKHEGLVGEFALRLANLVYSVVFRHEVRGKGSRSHKTLLGGVTVGRLCKLYPFFCLQNA